VLARELERSSGLVVCAFKLVAIRECLGPAEASTGNPEQHALLFLDLAGEREVLVRTFLPAERRRQQSEVDPIVA
jgi:hypothetical protein